MNRYPDGTIKYDPELILCDCGHSDHSIIYHKWDDKEYGREVYLEFCMNVNHKFLERLKIAFRYLFKKERYGSHGEINISSENIKGFKDIVNFLESKLNSNKHWELIRSFNKIKR